MRMRERKRLIFIDHNHKGQIPERRNPRGK